MSTPSPPCPAPWTLPAPTPTAETTSNYPRTYRAPSPISARYPTSLTISHISPLPALRKPSPTSKDISAQADPADSVFVDRTDDHPFDLPEVDHSQTGLVSQKIDDAQSGLKTKSDLDAQEPETGAHFGSDLYEDDDAFSVPDTGYDLYWARMAGKRTKYSKGSAEAMPSSGKGISAVWKLIMAWRGRGIRPAVRYEMAGCYSIRVYAIQATFIELVAA